jgi:hypothetical protein
VAANGPGDTPVGGHFDIVAGLIMTAFTVEARINFVGWKRVADWKEFSPTSAKLGRLYQQLGMNSPDEAVRPFSTLADLRKFRDTLAHGKPETIEFHGEVVVDEDELSKIDLAGKWEANATSAFLSLAIEDSDQVWHDLLDAFGIDVYETLTQADGGNILIERIGD